MELSEDTLSVMRNFATINSNIVIEEGNVLKTISESKTVLARAELTESLPRTFGIYELPEFLSVMGLVDQARLDFDTDFVTVSDQSGRSKIKYFYSEPDILTKPTKDIVMPATEVQFVLDRGTMSKIRKAAMVLGHGEVMVTSTDGVVSLTVADNDDSTSNAFSIEVEGTSETDNLRAILSIGDLKMVDGDYEVSLSSKLISHFVNKESNMQYWVALQKNSTF